jgi:hypothetical protein
MFNPITLYTSLTGKRRAWKNMFTFNEMERHL